MLRIDARPTLIASIALALFACQRAPAGPTDVGELPTVSSESETLASVSRTLWDVYDPDAALAVVEEIDQYFRVRGNRGYQATLDEVRRALTDGGFDETAVVRTAFGEAREAWTPVSASLMLLSEEPVLLHGFEDETGFDRCSLLVGSHPVDGMEYEVVDAASTPDATQAAGRIVLINGSAYSAWPRYAQAGAVGVLTYDLESYHRVDERDDIVSFGYLPGGGTDTFGFSISRATYETLQMQMAANEGVARVQVDIDVSFDTAQADVVEATIPGTNPELGSVVFFTHIDEPGANDNASGTGALAELAVTTRRAIEEGLVAAPRLNLIFLWGQEYESSIAWLDAHEGEIAAGLVLDMVGEDPAELGSPFLVERMPDPAAVWLRAPDEHTEWGAGYVNPANLWGHYLNDVVIAASQAVGVFDGPWDARSNPFEGGSDHEPFLGQRIPSILGWHFTDDAYHTNYDRFDRVSADEMRRVSATVGAVALRIAAADDDAAMEFLEIVVAAATERLGYVETSSREALDAGSQPTLEQTIIDAWETWYDEAMSSVLTTPGLETTEALSAEVETARQAWGLAVGELESSLLP